MKDEVAPIHNKPSEGSSLSWAPAHESPADPRVIRVFVSSTFRDMHAEREQLVKHVFPQLRKLCESRGVTWGEVDLRWGISDEQKAEGKVLPICLAEIQRCRPYFIGMLGERYGWIPEEIDPQVIAQEPWLAEHRERSVTELEILHGVLNDPRMADHALFYFRSPAYSDTLTAAERAAFREEPTPGDIARFGPAEAEQRATERRQKLAALKTRIRDSGLPVPVREDYADPRALGALVLRDLTALIDHLYPEGSTVDPFDREAAEHEAFARSRAGVYVGRQEYFDRLDAHVAGDGPPLVVLGESGSGKSALLANWALRYRARGTEPPARPLMLVHFIGATPYSTDWAAMLRRIMGELKRHCDIRQEIPDKPDDPRAAFANWLHMAGARRRVILILDALNQLEDRDGAPDLVWLPPVIPANVRVILSTLPGRSLDDLRKRGWSTLEVKPLDSVERTELITKYLLQYTKALARSQVERITGAPAAGNPLYLRELLEELRQFGDRSSLGQQIEYYVAAATVDDLYVKIFKRWEDDYEADYPGLVGVAMSLLWAARRGLTEAELLDLLGEADEPLPAGKWSPLRLAADHALVSRSGLLGFFHPYLAQAVVARYLPEERLRQASHVRLVGYFGSKAIETRALNELPWQLAQAKAWPTLYKLLAYLPFFAAVWRTNQFEIQTFWAQVEANSPHNVVDAYRPVLEVPEDNLGYIWDVASLLEGMGHPAEAFAIRSVLTEHYRRIGDLVNLQALLGGQAKALGVRGDLDGAIAKWKEQERICRELGNRDGLQAALGGQANGLRVRGDIDGATDLYKEQERLCRELGNKDGLSVALGNQGGILYVRGDLDGAMALHKEVERICRELGNKDGLYRALGSQGSILYVRGDLDGAMALQKEAESICRELGNKDGLQAVLGNQGGILCALGDLDGAMALHKEEERILRELGKKDGLQDALRGQANILRLRGDLDGAIALHKEQGRICTELGDKNGLQAALGDLAHVLYSQGDLVGAMALFNEKEGLCRELGNKDGLQAALGGQANVLHLQGDLEGAMALHKEQERICRELGDKKGLQTALGNQANVIADRGELEGAIALHKEEERICRELGNKDGLQEALGNLGSILSEHGDLEAAVAAFREKERICRELGNKDGLQAALGGQATILHLRGDPNGAMALYKETERLCREVGNKVGLQWVLGNQATVIADRGDLEGAMELFKEQERVCSELGYKNGLQDALGNQARVLSAQDNLDGAMLLFKSQERTCRELGNKAGLQGALGGQANVLRFRGDLDGAMALYGEQERICRALGNKNALQAALGDQAAALMHRRDLDGAMALYLEKERICRELGAPEGLATSLFFQAAILEIMGRADSALPLAEEAYQLATDHGIAALAEQVMPILEAARTFTVRKRETCLVDLETVRQGFPRSVMRFVAIGTTEDRLSRPTSRALYVSSEFRTVLGNPPAWSNEEAVNAFKELTAALIRDGWQRLDEDKENWDREKWWRHAYGRQMPIGASAGAQSPTDAFLALIGEFSEAQTSEDEVRVLFRHRDLLKSPDFVDWLTQFSEESASEPEDEPGRYPNAGLYRALHLRLVGISGIEPDILPAAKAAENGLRKLAPREAAKEVYASVLSAVLSLRDPLAAGALLWAHGEMLAEPGWLPWLEAALNRANDPARASFLAETALHCSRLDEVAFGPTALLAKISALKRNP